MAGISRGVWNLAQQDQTGEESARESRASGVFVTATGTEVGKTVVSAVLAHTLAADGKRVAVFKPAFTGMDEYPDYDEAAAIAAVAAAGDGWPAVAGLPDPATLRAAARSSQPARSRPTRRSPPTASTRRCRRTWRPAWRAWRSIRSG